MTYWLWEKQWYRRLKGGRWEQWVVDGSFDYEWVWSCKTYEPFEMPWPYLGRAEAEVYTHRWGFKARGLA